MLGHHLQEYSSLFSVALSMSLIWCRRFTKGKYYKQLLYWEENIVFIMQTQCLIICVWLFLKGDQVKNKLGHLSKVQGWGKINAAYYYYEILSCAWFHCRCVCVCVCVCVFVCVCLMWLHSCHLITNYHYIRKYNSISALLIKKKNKQKKQWCTYLFIHLLVFTLNKWVYIKII